MFTTNKYFLTPDFIKENWLLSEIEKKRNEDEVFLLAYLSHEEVPLDFVFDYVNNNPMTEEVVVALLKNNSCPDPILFKIFEYAKGLYEPKERIALLRKIAAHPKAEEKTILNLVSLNLEDVWTIIVKRDTLPLVALRYIMSKTKRVGIRRLVISISINQNNNFPELISLSPKEEHLAVVNSLHFSNEEIAKLWMKGKDYQHAIAANPNIHSALLENLFEISKENLWKSFGKNPNAPASILEKIAFSQCVEARKAAAQNPNTPMRTLIKLSNDRNTIVQCAVIKNPNATEAMLLSFAKKEGEVFAEGRIYISSLPHISLDIVKVLLKDKNKHVRANVATHHELTVSCLKSLAADPEPSVSSKVLKNPNMGCISKLSDYQVFLGKNPELAFLFYGIESTKKTVKLLINSKHQEEIKFVFNSQDINSLDALSAVQSMFLTRKLKTDREGYIAFLSHLNTHVKPSKFASLSVDGGTLSDIKKYLGKEIIVDIISQYSNGPARDTLSMLGSVLSFENKSQNKRHAKLVINYLETKGSKFDYSFSLHDFLSKMSSKLFGGIKRNFKQKAMLPNLKEAQEFLEEQKEFKGWRINWPKNTDELSFIGKRQNHCVGSKYYSDRCVDGSNITFQIAPKGNLKHGYTFQFSANGSLLQKQGFSNSRTPQAAALVAMKVLSIMKKQLTPELLEEIEDIDDICNMDPYDKEFIYEEKSELEVA